MKRKISTRLAAVVSVALCSCSFAMKTNTAVKQPMFLSPPLADEWSKWVVGEWEGTGESDTGQGNGIERIEFALNGQFLVCRGQARITEISPEQSDYLKKYMHASAEEIKIF